MSENRTVFFEYSNNLKLFCILVEKEDFAAVSLVQEFASLPFVLHDMREGHVEMRNKVELLLLKVELLDTN